MIPPKTLNAALGQTTASYPVPLLVGTLCGSALLTLCISLGFKEIPDARWSLFGLAALLFLSAIALLGYAVVRQPALLRNDRTQIMLGAMQVFGDDEIGDLAKEHVGRTVETYLTHLQPETGGLKAGKKSLARDEDDGGEDV